MEDVGASDGDVQVSDLDGVVTVDHPRYARWTLVVGHDLFGRAAGEEAPVVEDGDVLCEANDDRHVVLDHQHRPPFSVQAARSASVSSGTSSVLTPAIGSSSKSTCASAARRIASSSLRLSP